jgi:8-oxo-dGTP diphosphatase
MKDLARPQKLVVAALIHREGQLLISRRRPDQAMPLLWEFPGGKVEPGEAPVAALEREVREELGCDVSVGAIEEVVFHPYGEFDLLMLTYWCTVVRGEPRAVEVAEIAWVDPRTLPDRELLPADFPLARRLAREAAASPENAGFKRANRAPTSD